MTKVPEPESCSGNPQISQIPADFTLKTESSMFHRGTHRSVRPGEILLNLFYPGSICANLRPLRMSSASIRLSLLRFFAANQQHHSGAMLQPEKANVIGDEKKLRIGHVRREK